MRGWPGQHSRGSPYVTLFYWIAMSRPTLTASDLPYIIKSTPPRADINRRAALLIRRTRKRGTRSAGPAWPIAPTPQDNLGLSHEDSTALRHRALRRPTERRRSRGIACWGTLNKASISSISGFTRSVSLNPSMWPSRIPRGRAYLRR